MDKRSDKEWEVTGFDKFEEDLKKLEAWASQDVILQSFREGAEIIEEEAKSLAPVKTGRLRGAIRTRKGKGKKGNTSILVSLADRFFVGDEYYGAFQEFGWHAGKRKSHSKSAGVAQGRKEVKGLHFLEYATLEKENEAVDVIMKSLSKRIDQELGR